MQIVRFFLASLMVVSLWGSNPYGFSNYECPPIPGQRWVMYSGWGKDDQGKPCYGLTCVLVAPESTKKKPTKCPPINPPQQQQPQKLARAQQRALERQILSFPPVSGASKPI